MRLFGAEGNASTFTFTFFQQHVITIRQKSLQRSVGISRIPAIISSVFVEIVKERRKSLGTKNYNDAWVIKGINCERQAKYQHPRSTTSRCNLSSESIHQCSRFEEDAISSFRYIRQSWPDRILSQLYELSEWQPGKVIWQHYRK
jgi:hypothetical protein